jgi:hypothetical protein
LRAWTAIIAAVLAIASVSPAQQLSVPDKPRFVFQKLGEDVGLGTLTVTSIAQDEQGFMWIGTQSGLIRYDGRRARKFSIEQGLPSTIIDQVVAGPQNRMVIGTRKGVAVYDGSSFQRLPRIEGATADPGYQYVTADRSGNVYWATTMGLFRMPTGASRWDEIRIDGVARSPIGAVYVAGDGKVWFAGGGRIGVLKANRGSRPPTRSAMSRSLRLFRMETEFCGCGPARACGATTVRPENSFVITKIFQPRTTMEFRRLIFRATWSCRRLRESIAVKMAVGRRSTAAAECR